MSGKIACERSPLKGHSIQQTRLKRQFMNRVMRKCLLSINMPLDLQNTRKHHQDVFFWHTKRFSRYVLHTSLTCTENFSSQKLPTSIGSSKKLLMKNNIAKVQEIYWTFLSVRGYLKGHFTDFCRFNPVQMSIISSFHKRWFTGKVASST